MCKSDHRKKLDANYSVCWACCCSCRALALTHLTHDHCGDQLCYCHRQCYNNHQHHHHHHHCQSVSQSIIVTTHHCQSVNQSIIIIIITIFVNQSIIFTIIISSLSIRRFWGGKSGKKSELPSPDRAPDRAWCSGFCISWQVRCKFCLNKRNKRGLSLKKGILGFRRCVSLFERISQYVSVKSFLRPSWPTCSFPQSLVS